MLVNFRIWEQESVPWCDEFKNKDSKHLGILLIFTLIPLMPKMCGLSMSYMCMSREKNEEVSYQHTNHFMFIKKIMYVSVSF